MEIIRQANDRPVDASQARELLRKALQKHEAGVQLGRYGKHAGRQLDVAPVECRLLGGGKDGRR